MGGPLSYGIIANLRKAAFTGATLGVLIGCQSVDIDLPVVDSLSIEGNERLKDEKIIDGLATNESSSIPLVGTKRYFDETVFEQDLKRIVRIYEAEGYYGTSILGTDVVEREGAVDITVKVSEGREVVTERYEITGFPLPLPSLKVREGERFKEDEFAQDQAGLKKALFENGHPFGTIDAQARVDPQSGRVNVSVAVAPGPRVRIADVRVVGNNEVDALQIMENSDLLPERIYKESEVDAAREKLVDLGTFQAVDIALADTEKAKGATGEIALPIVITVAEGKMQSIGLGGGIGFDTGRNEGRLRGIYSNRNFLGGLRRFDLEVVPAYVFTPSITLTERRGFGGRFTASFQQPDLFLSRGVHHLSFISRVESERDIQNAFVYDSAKARTGLLWPNNARSNFEVGVNFELFGLDALTAQLGQCTSNCSLYYFDQRAVLDKRDNPISARRGYWLSLTLQEAGFKGDFNYVMVLPEARAYVPVGRKNTYVSRVQLGNFFTDRDETTPIPKRFYAGGSYSHRGFGLRRFSPSVQLPSGNSQPVGGDALFLFNQEWRTALSENFSTVGFLDVGDVESTYSLLAWERMVPAVGLGFRYATPVGPVRLDVGYRVGDDERFTKEPRFAFHIYIGDAF